MRWLTCPPAGRAHWHVSARACAYAPACASASNSTFVLAAACPTRPRLARPGRSRARFRDGSCAHVRVRPHHSDSPAPHRRAPAVLARLAPTGAGPTPRASRPPAPRACRPVPPTHPPAGRARAATPACAHASARASRRASTPHASARLCAPASAGAQAPAGAFSMVYSWKKKSSPNVNLQ